MMKYRTAELPDHTARVLLLQRVEEFVQPLGQSARLGQDLEFLARRQAVVDGEMFVLRYRHAERLQGGVERLVMPFARVDQDPVHVEQHRCDFLTHRKSPSPPAVDRCTASAGYRLVAQCAFRWLPAIAPMPGPDCGQIGRAHVCTPVTNAHPVCRPLLEKKNTL